MPDQTMTGRDHFGEWLDDMGLRKPGRPYPDHDAKPDGAPAMPTDHTRVAELLREIEEVLGTKTLESGWRIERARVFTNEALRALRDERGEEYVAKPWPSNLHRWNVLHELPTAQHLILYGVTEAEARQSAATLNRLSRLERAAREVVGRFGRDAHKAVWVDGHLNDAGARLLNEIVGMANRLNAALDEPGGQR